MTSTTAAELLARSHRLGSDPRNTNFAGGNTSGKGRVLDPVDGAETEVMWVKGSGGDLGTLTSEGLSIIRMDRLRALVHVYPGLDREDDMVGMLEFCLHGHGGAAPSIDTAMHGLVDAPHVDHLHPDSGIALATAEDGPELTERCFGDRVVWVPWRRPGFQLGLDISAIQRENPDAIGCILGGHGITAWGSTSRECEENSLSIIRTAEEFIDAHGKARPFGEVLPGMEPLAEDHRHALAARLAPVLRGLASRDRLMVGHYTDSPLVLDFLQREHHSRLAALGTSCPDHFIRTKVRPMVLDVPPSTPFPDLVARLEQLHEVYRREYAAYYDRWAAKDSPAMRGADPAIILIPGAALSHRAQLVYADPQDSLPHGALRNFSSRVAKWLFVRVLAGREFESFNSYRLIHGEIGRNVAAYTGSGVYLDVALTWVVSTVCTAPVVNRVEGRPASNYSFSRLLGHFGRLVVSTGTRPLLFVSLIGAVFVALGAVLTVYVIAGSLLGDIPVGGWASTFVAILVVGGATLLSLGIIAQYVGASTNMSLGKPLYVTVRDPHDNFDA